MRKVKKFIILPLGLLASNFFLCFYMDPWRIFFMQIFAQKKVFFIFRNLLGCAAYIFLIAFLFVCIFTNNPIKALFKKDTLKMLGIVFATELALRMVSDLLNKSMQDHYFLEVSQHGAVPSNEWYTASVILSGSVIHFAVIYLTLRLLIKSLNLGFVFRRWAFFDLVVLWAAVNYLNSHMMLCLEDYLIMAGNVTMTSVSISGLTMSMDAFNVLTLLGTAFVAMFMDLLIFEYINRCMKDWSESVPVENTNS